MNVKLFFAIIVCIAVADFSQAQVIRGKVTDADTGEGLPGCAIILKNTTLGTTTDIDGFYELNTNDLGDSIAASYIGYQINAKAFRKDLPEQEINFMMQSLENALQEVVILAGENPANIIVKNIIKNKEKNRITNLDAYQCEDYTKVEADLINIDQKMKDSKMLKPFDFVFNNIDSTSDEKPFLPVYVSETLFDVFYVKSENKEKRIPKAQKTSGISNQSFVEAVNRINDPFDIYDNWITIMEKGFASPFSDLGLHYYEYYIMDSTIVDGNFSYKLKYKPKRKQENTFYGEFWVADTTFAIERINLRMSSDVNINLVNRIVLYQDFTLQDNKKWLPALQKTLVDFSPTDKSPGIILRKTISLKNFNTEINPQSIAKKNTENYQPEDLIQDEAFWQKSRHDSLSLAEQKVYTMIDSIKNVPIYKTYVDIIRTLVDGYKVFGPIELGPYSSLMSNNVVEGYRFRLGIYTSENFSKRTRFGGYLAYGLGDKAFKYGGDIKWVISRKPFVLCGAGYKEDITSSSENSESLLETGIFAGFYRRPVPIKLLHIREGKVYFERYWQKGWSNRVTLLHRDMDPFGNITANGSGFNYKYLPNPENPTQIDTTINALEFIFKTKYAPGEKYLDGTFSRSSLGGKQPVIELQYTAGLKGVMGSQYAYHKLELSYHHWFSINPIGWFNYWVTAGKTFGTVPFLLMNVQNGNETYFYDKNAFNGMNRYEFVSDQFVSIMAVHHFEGFFLNKVPLLRKLKLREVAFFRGVIGTVSDANRLANQNNLFDPSKTDTYSGFRAPFPKPYMEAGFGIENILKVLRIDAVWRINYLDNPQAQAFTMRAGFDFYF